MLQLRAATGESWVTGGNQCGQSYPKRLAGPFYRDTIPPWTPHALERQYIPLITGLQPPPPPPITHTYTHTHTFLKLSRATEKKCFQPPILSPPPHFQNSSVVPVLFECKVRNASYGPIFFPFFMSKARSSRVMKTRKKNTQWIHNLPYGPSKRC